MNMPNSIFPMPTRTQTRKAPPTIVPEGLYRWSEIAPVLPIAREAWRLRVLAGTAPKPIKLGIRCTAWRGVDLLAWLADPNGYHV